MEEIIDLNYIRYNLHNGNLSENYFDIKGLDLCNYFTLSDLRGESLNLASEVVESGVLMAQTGKTYQVSKTINTARKAGVIGKFNPTIFISSVACGYDNKKLKIALEVLAQANSYLSNINYGYSQEGYVNSLTNSISSAKYYLDEYIKSPVAMVRGGTNWFLNALKFLFGTAMNPTEKQEIEKTEYQIAQEISGAITNYNFYLSNPNKEEIILKSNKRVNLKTNQFYMKYNPFLERYNSVKNINPYALNILFTNVFFNPNYNLSTGKDCFNNAKLNKKMLL